jgi:hypothetical protein
VTEDVCSFCLDLDELFLFTQEVTGQEVSTVDFKLKSLRISEEGNRSVQARVHTHTHKIIMSSLLWRKQDLR